MKSSRCVARRERGQALIRPLRQINLSPPNICDVCLRLSTATQRRGGSRLHGGEKQKQVWGFFMRRGTMETSLMSDVGQRLLQGKHELQDLPRGSTGELWEKAARAQHGGGFASEVFTQLRVCDKKGEIYGMTKN